MQRKYFDAMGVAVGEMTPEEAELPLGQFDTRDYHEGFRAFLEKRRPEFIGE